MPRTRKTTATPTATPTPTSAPEQDLAPNEAIPTIAPTYQLLDLDDIQADPSNEHRPFDPQDAEDGELLASVQAGGVNTPIEVYALPGGGYLLKSGHRRTAAARLAGLLRIPAIIHAETPDSVERALKRTLANLANKPLDPISLAHTFREMLDTVDASGAPLIDQEHLAAYYGKSQPWISNAIRLLELPEAAQELIRRGELTSSHGIALLGVKLPKYEYHRDAPMMSVEQCIVLMAQSAIQDGIGSKALITLVAQHNKTMTAIHEYNTQSRQDRERFDRLDAERNAAQTGDEQATARREYRTLLTREHNAEVQRRLALRRQDLPIVIDEHVKNETDAQRLQILRAVAAIACLKPYYDNHNLPKKGDLQKALDQASVYSDLIAELRDLLVQMFVAAADSYHLRIDSDMGKLADHWFSLNAHLSKHWRDQDLDAVPYPDFDKLVAAHFADIGDLAPNEVNPATGEIGAAAAEGLDYSTWRPGLCIECLQPAEEDSPVQLLCQSCVATHQADGVGQSEIAEWAATSAHAVALAIIEDPALPEADALLLGQFLNIPATEGPAGPSTEPPAHPAGAGEDPHSGTLDDGYSLDDGFSDEADPQDPLYIAARAATILDHLDHRANPENFARPDQIAENTPAYVATLWSDPHDPKTGRLADQIAELRRQAGEA